MGCECNNNAVELIRDCCGGGCDEHKCDPLFDIASPIEGQTLKYSEEFKAFINVTADEFSQIPVDWNATSGNVILSSGSVVFSQIPNLYSSLFVSVTRLQNSNTSATISNSLVLGDIIFNTNGSVSKSLLSAPNTTISGPISETLLFASNSLITDKESNTLQSSAIFGYNNTIDTRANYSLIAGNSNKCESYSTVVAGSSNELYGDVSYSTVLFGEDNLIGTPTNLGITAYGSFVAGFWNKITSAYTNASMFSNFVFGQNHTIELTVSASGLYANTILGGQTNIISGVGYGNTILGGQGSYIYTNTSTSAGYTNQNNTYISFNGNTLPSTITIQDNIISSSENSKISGASVCGIYSSETSELGIIITGTGGTYTPGRSSSIVSGQSNKIFSYNSFNANYVSIIGGQNNLIISKNINMYSGAIIGATNSTSLSDGSIILGGTYNIIENTTSYNYNTIIGGTYNYNNGKYSTLIGRSLRSAYSDQVVIGKANDNKADSIFEIGWGTPTTNGVTAITPKNVFRVRTDGTIGTDAFRINGTGTPTGLGAKCPAVTPTVPYAWIQFELSDGSIVYMPAWK